MPKTWADKSSVWTKTFSICSTLISCLSHSFPFCLQREAVLYHNSFQASSRCLKLLYIILGKPNAQFLYKTVEQVSHFTYLGSHTQGNGYVQEEITSQTGKEWLHLPVQQDWIYAKTYCFEDKMASVHLKHYFCTNAWTLKLEAQQITDKTLPHANALHRCLLSISLTNAEVAQLPLLLFWIILCRHTQSFALC